ncbi:unnamed protein product [Nyctereutes procyonoides]|uniref:(raccoon dog) hypothetical protein n=1 Tax=Nyctereutes procyonoides TaxID=34880 RepID=A0A812A0G8_NYCPR|nr:unnamed protein product [Nyctereutes procyonoides]
MKCGINMGKQKKGRKYVNMKQMLSLQDQRLKEKDRLKSKKKEKKDPSILKERELQPPYHILVDINFINFSIKAKLDLVQSVMDCLYTKLMAKNPRFEQLICTHKGTHAGNCLIQIDWNLKQRIQNIPGQMPSDYEVPWF